MKILTIVLGILLAIGGFYCMITPVQTYSALSLIIGISMVVEGVAGIVRWFIGRKTGEATGWTLAGGILSLVLGIFLLGSFAMQLAVDAFIAFLIAFWLAVAGGVRIISAITARSELGAKGAKGWIIELILGILIVILGILCIFNPLAVMAGVGFTIGLSIVFMGVELIVGEFIY